jgi:hypothetical protein
MEYKKRNVWNLDDIRLLVTSILRHNKKMEKVGEELPHKTYKELIIFFHMFKKVLNLKEALKNCNQS